MAKRRRVTAADVADQVTGLLSEVDQFTGLVRTAIDSCAKISARSVEIEEVLARTLKRLGDLEAEHDALARRVAKLERGVA